MIFDIILVLKGKKIDVHITQVGNAVGARMHVGERLTRCCYIYIYR